MNEEEIEMLDAILGVGIIVAGITGIISAIIFVVELGMKYSALYVSGGLFVISILVIITLILIDMMWVEE